MMKNRILEVCAFTIQTCRIAEKAGAARVELCDNPIEGGTTPSYGTLRQVRDAISIDLYPIIRPRSGNYFYNEDEYAIIKNDILACRELHCNGISVGTQNIKGEIDKEWLKRIVEWAGPLDVTCNRAFDGTPDPFRALEDIIECGCKRVLTSGQKSAAPDAGKLLGQLVDLAGNRIIIMPGAGVNSSNLDRLITASDAKEFHSSARRVAPNPLEYINDKVSDYGNVYIADENEIGNMLAILERRQWNNN
jgi:copper homeostasis protein